MSKNEKELPNNIAELSQQVEDYRQKKLEKSAQLSEMDARLNFGLSLLTQLKDAENKAKEKTANLDKSFKEQHAEKFSAMEAREKAVAVKEKSVTDAEEKARAKQNEAEKILSDAFKTQKANDALKEKLTARHKKYEGFLKAGKELLEEKE